MLDKIPRSTLYNRSIRWFLDHYLLGRKKPKEIIRPESKELEPGKIYTFQYDPLYKDKLSFYDNMPMNFIIGHIETKSGTRNPYGINLSFIPPRVRVKILDKILDIYMKEIDENRKIISEFKTLYNHFPTKPIDIDYNKCKKLLKNSGFEFAIRSYIYTRMETEPMIITYDDWWRMPTFPSQFIEKMNVMAIYGRYQRKMNPSFKFNVDSISKSINLKRFVD